jgi:integrase/recombinase XerD
MSTSYERLVLDYLLHLVASGSAHETVRCRRVALAVFAKFLKRKRVRALTEVEGQTVEEYAAALRTGALSRRGGPLADGTRRDYLLALSEFHKWLVRQGKLLTNPAADVGQEGARRAKRLPHPLSADEMMKVIQAGSPTTALGLRDRAILELLYSTGIRRSELANLNVGDVRLESREAMVVNGKGGKDRLVPVGQWACFFIDAYVRNVRPWHAASAEERALFVEYRSGKRLSPRGVADVVERATVRSGVGRRVSPHTFRHTMATEMLRNHADLRHVQAILGHTSLRSTQIYTHVSIEDLKDVVRRAHPHGKRASGPGASGAS